MSFFLLKIVFCQESLFLKNSDTVSELRTLFPSVFFNAQSPIYAQNPVFLSRRKAVS